MYFNCQSGSLYALLAYCNTIFNVPSSPQRIDWRCVVVEKISYEPEKVMEKEYTKTEPFGSDYGYQCTIEEEDPNER